MRSVFRLVLFNLILTLVGFQGLTEPPLAGVRYQPLTFTVEVDPTTYRDPFNSRDIEVLGLFQSPLGEQIVIPGFWMQPFDCAVPCADYDLQSVGDPVWQVRFTPTEPGPWSYTLQVRDNAAVVLIEDGQFEVADSEERGFIRMGPNGRYFQFDNDQPYFPIGHNLNWSWDDIGGLTAYDDWLHDLSAAGGNYARVMIDIPWFINLEWAGPVGDYQAAQRQAAELDLLLERAAEHGVYLQLVLLWHQALLTYNGPPVVLPEGVDRPNVSADWDDNPYNVFNGGPLSGPSVFFFSDEAQELFRRRLRYIVARWGYSPQIFAWEVIDRIDRTANFDPNVAGPWLRSTVSYLRQIDQQDHLITAGSREVTPVVADNALLDFASAQFYQRRPIESVGDQVQSVINLVQRHRETDLTPMLLADFSLNPWYEPTTDDPGGVHFQNTLWASVMSGASGGPASDWWDTYVIPQNLTRYYAPLAAFTNGIDWPNLDLQSAQAGLLAASGEAYQPVRLTEYRRQLMTTPESVATHVITADGVFPAIQGVPSFIYGQVYNNQFSQVQRYRVTPPVDTYLEIGVEAVSTQADAQLVVEVDTAVVVQLDLRAGTRDAVVRIPLAAGEHTIVLDNQGGDWLEIAYLEIGHLFAPARVLTLRDTQAGVVLAWLQHRAYTWERVAAGETAVPVTFAFEVGGLPEGRYVAEIWDPLEGAVLGEELLRIGEDGVLQVDLLPFARQLAVRAIRQPADSATIVTPTPTLLPFVAATNTPRPGS
jgi:hypothetical protein